MAALLGDDGTLDTVIYCSECGEEARYNYDGGDIDEETAPQSYDAFIDWCLENFESEHECEVRE